MIPQISANICYLLLRISKFKSYSIELKKVLSTNAEKLSQTWIHGQLGRLSFEAAA